MPQHWLGTSPARKRSAGRFLPGGGNLCGHPVTPPDGRWSEVRLLSARQKWERTARRVLPEQKLLLFSAPEFVPVFHESASTVPVSGDLPQMQSVPKNPDRATGCRSYPQGRGIAPNRPEHRRPMPASRNPQGQGQSAPPIPHRSRCCKQCRPFADPRSLHPRRISLGKMR